MTTAHVRRVDGADLFAALAAAPFPDRLLESADLLHQWRNAVGLSGRAAWLLRRPLTYV